jgi:hypothetical protein
LRRRASRTRSAGNATDGHLRDWKFGTTKVDIAARAIIVGLRDVYHPRYPAAESRVPDQYRADIFLKEFAEFEKNGKLPNLVLILLYDDHTEGTSPGFPTPSAAVADNDLALGRIVEAISHSRYWKESAIFVTEDDSQDRSRSSTDIAVGFAMPVRGTAGRQQLLLNRQHIGRLSRSGLSPLNQFDLAAERCSALSHAEGLPPTATQPDPARRDESAPASLTDRSATSRQFS